MNTLVKVSVVVPVYNPGENIVGLIDSLAAQSLPSSEFEVIFVDDGSTDDTPARLDAACAAHPNMRVSTIPNSGWPGRPRNVGTDLATGEYVFYSDNDDEFFPESLERLYAMAAANGSDIVYGKVVRTGRPTPYWSLWKRTIPVADPVADRVVVSRTVHKLFRRQFLVDNEIRFPEGKVRLEDFAFMAQAIPSARVISILADYPCYRWIHRTDGSNNSSGSVKQSTYWGYFTAALETMAERAGEGPLLDDARLVACEQAFSRFSPSSYLGRSPAGQEGAFAAIRDYITAQMPASLDPRLPVLKRLRVQALRSGDKDAFDALQRLRQEMSIELSVQRFEWDGGRLHVAATAQLRGVDTLSVLERGPGPSAGSDSLQLSSAAAPWADAAARALRAEDRGSLELTIRHRATGLEWPIESTSSLVPEPAGGGVRLRVRVTASIDPLTGAFGQPLDDGFWDVLARGQFLGESTLVGLPAPGPRAGGLVTAGRREARAYVTRAGKLALQLTHPTVSAGASGSGGTGAPTVAATRWQGQALRVELTGLSRPSVSVVVRRRHGGEGDIVPLEAGAALVPLDHVGVGEDADAYVRIESAAGVRDERLQVAPGVTLAQQAPFALSVTAGGGLSVRRLRADQPVPPAAVSGPARAASARPTRELPTAAGVLTMLPAPVQRVVRGVRRRLKARR